MKLWYNRTSKDPTYFVQKGYRNGKKTTTKNIHRIGKHSELLQITDDPLSYAKEQVNKFNEEERNSRISMEVKIDFAEKIRAKTDLVSLSTNQNIGYFFLQKIYQELDLASFFKKVCKEKKITFDTNLVNRFMTYSRILDPDSKFGMHEHLSRYFENPTFEYVHILRTMDLLESHFDEYIEHLFENSQKIVKRNTSVCYYDCTNYSFEIEQEDEDYVDPVTGEVLKGLRKYGIAKNHKAAPLVEMGLFMDKDGIPLSMCLTSGSDNEQTTAIPAEKKLVKILKGKRLIYCADAGLGSLNIRNFNSMGGRAFIVTQSVKKLSEVLKKAVFNDCDYRLLSTGESASLEYMKSFDKKDPEKRRLYDDRIYKVIEADKPIDLGLYEEKVSKNGTIRKVKAKGVVPQKIIITFSRKVMEYQRYIRARQIERAKTLLKTIDPESYKKGPHDVTRFIKRTSFGNSGEKAKDLFELDFSAIEKEAIYDGFYAIATNLDDDPAAIIDISANRYKIEDCFRVMKTHFDAQPVYHSKRERITAHFMICYTALLVFRLLEKKLSEAGTHFTIDNIIETLQNMSVANLEDMCYMSTYTSSQVCTALNSVFGLGLDKKYYQPKELQKKIRNILK